MLLSAKNLEIAKEKKHNSAGRVAQQANILLARLVPFVGPDSCPATYLQPGKAVEKSSGPWSPAPTLETWKKILAPAITSTQLLLLCPFGEQTSIFKIFSLCLSF